jgi:hypothetical protein
LSSFGYQINVRLFAFAVNAIIYTPFSGGSRNFEKGGPLPKGGGGPEIAKK